MSGTPKRQPLRRAAYLPILAVALGVALPTPTPAQTLGELLARSNVAPDAIMASRANRAITSYAVRDSAGVFAVAWYWATGSTLPDSLNISLTTRATATWSHAALPREQSDSTGGRARYSVGSAMNVLASRDYLFVDTHLNPSAGTLLVLNRRLEFIATLSGWSKVLLPSGALLYSPNLVHFSSTHPEELWLYDTRTGRNVAVYPTQPYDTVRRQYIERVRAIYTRMGPDWFRINNHHMDAERFDTSIGTPVSDAAGNRVAFIARFGTDPGARAATPLLEVLVLCTEMAARSRCTETELTALRQLHPGWSDEQILQDALSRR